MNQKKVESYITEIFTPHDFSCDVFQWISLPMNASGWKEASKKMPKFGGIYIHFSASGVPLRIGIAQGEGGIHARWFTALSCHRKSFYQQESAPLNYRCFFQQIQIHYPQTYILCLAVSKPHVRQGEKILFSTLKPLWERKGMDGQYLWKAKRAFQQNPNITLPETEEFR
jgi:hypothetical protein